MPLALAVKHPHMLGSVVAPGAGEMHQPHRLLRRPAVGSRDPGDAHRNVGMRAQQRALGHGARHRLADRAVLANEDRADPALYALAQDPVGFAEFVLNGYVQLGLLSDGQYWLIDPGTALAGMVRRIAPEVRAHAVGDAATLAAAIEQLATPAEATAS